jgi:hypothetical protein
LLYNMGHSAFALVLIPMYQMYAWDANNIHKVLSKGYY